MIDKDQKEKSAVEKAFPKTNIILCWFHVLQAIYREFNKKESGVSGNGHTETRKSILAYLRKMRYAATKQAFDELAEQLHKVFSQYPHVIEKLQKKLDC
jgi:transposase